MKAFFIALFSRLKTPLVILAAFLAVYALIGFLLVPYLLETPLMTTLSEKTGNRFSLAKAAFNPFEMSLRLEQFSVHDPDDVTLLHVDALAVDFEVGSVLSDAYALEFLNIDAPQINLKRLKDGRLNLVALIPPDSEPEEPSDSATVPLLIKKAGLTGGKIDFEDQTLKSPMTVRLDDVQFQVEQLGTLPGQTGSFAFEAKSDFTDKLALSGQVTLDPISTRSNLVLKALQLAKFNPYLEGLSDYRLGSGILDTEVKFSFEAKPDEPLVAVSETGIRLEKLKVSSTDPGAPAGEIQGLAFEDVSFDSTPGKLALGRIKVDTLKVVPAGPTGPEAMLAGLNLEKLQIDLPGQTLALASASATQTVLNQSPGQRALVAIPNLEIGGVDTNLKERRLEIKNLASDQARIDGWLREDGTLNYTALFAPQATPEATVSPPPPPAAPTAAPWVIKVGEIKLNKSRLNFEDRSLLEPAKLTVAPLDFTVKNFSNQPGGKFHVDLAGTINEKGVLKTSGTTSILPLAADFQVDLEHLRLADFQPYLNPVLDAKLRNGNLNVSGRLNVNRSDDQKLDLGWRGNASVDNLSVTGGTTKDEVLRWKRLTVSDVQFDLEPMRLAIGEIVSDKAYAELAIEPGGTTNLSRLVKQQPPAEPTAEAKAEKSSPMPLDIGAIRLSDSTVKFSDLTLRPRFSAVIDDLNGAIKRIDSSRKTAAPLFFEGKVDKYAPVKIQGRVNPFAATDSSEVEMQFKNLSLTTLTPYSGKFAGYAIEKGKMTMDLKYTIQRGRLEADSQFILDQLTLGEKVDSPNATSLPVSLAIALMKDRKGRIDLNLPIRGNLDDPKVSVGALVGKALFTLVKKIVTSPFTLLSSLVGASDKLDQISFEPGQSELGKPAQQKLRQVALALKARPRLRLEVKGVSNRISDRDGIAENKLLKQIRLAKYEEMDRDTRPARSEEVPITDKEFWDFFPDIYEKIIGHSPDSDNLQAAKTQLIQAIPVKHVDLRLLAQARGRAIRDFLIEESGMSDERIYLLDVKVQAKETGKDVISTLSLGT